MSFESQNAVANLSSFQDALLDFSVFDGTRSDK